MDKPLITIATPHRRDFTPEFVESLAKTLTADLRLRFEFLTRPGTLLHEQRNALCREAKGSHILFCDTDIAWQPQDVKALLDLGVDIVGGLYISKTPPFLPYVFDEADGIIRPLTQVPDRPFRCAAVGTGFLLIRRRVLDVMLDPAFIRGHGWPFDPEKNDAWQSADPCSATAWAPEDISFCLRARKAGFSIWAHSQVRPAHIGVFPFTADLWLKHDRAAHMPYNDDMEGLELEHGRLLELIDGGMDLCEALLQAQKEEVKSLLSAKKISKEEAKAVLDWIAKLNHKGGESLEPDARGMG